ncbi:mitochondrial import inner membrane translocase subunit tim23-1, partial [Phtheirospermum japonicum]
HELCIICQPYQSTSSRRNPARSADHGARSHLIHRERLSRRHDYRHHRGFRLRRQGYRSDRHLETEDQSDPQRVGSFRQAGREPVRHHWVDVRGLGERYGRC